MLVVSPELPIWFNSRMKIHLPMSIISSLTLLGSGIALADPDPTDMVRRAMTAAGQTQVDSELPTVTVEGYLDPSPNPVGRVVIQFTSDAEDHLASRMIWLTDARPFAVPDDLQVDDGSLLGGVEPEYIRIQPATPLPTKPFVAEAQINGSHRTWRYSMSGGWTELDAPPPSPLPGNPALVLYSLREAAANSEVTIGEPERFAGVEAETLTDDAAGEAFVRTWFFAPESNELLGVRFASVEDARPPRVIYFDNWQTVEGTAIPTEIRSQGSAHSTITLRLTHVLLDPDVDGAFEDPRSDVEKDEE